MNQYCDYSCTNKDPWTGYCRSSACIKQNQSITINLSNFEYNNEQQKTTNEFEIVEVKTIDLIHPNCPICGFNNPQIGMFRVCPICKSNLVARTIDASKPFCATISIG